MKKLQEKRDEIKELPFQLQITYTAPDGSRAVRVYTKVQKFTRDRAEAEKNLQSEDIIWSNAAQKMSNLVLTSNVVASKVRSKQMKKYQIRSNLNAAPVEFMAQACIIGNMDDMQRVSELRDEDASALYKAKKINRKNFSKN